MKLHPLDHAFWKQLRYLAAPWLACFGFSSDGIRVDIDAWGFAEGWSLDDGGGVRDEGGVVGDGGVAVDGRGVVDWGLAVDGGGVIDSAGLAFDGESLAVDGLSWW